MRRRFDRVTARSPVQDQPRHVEGTVTAASATECTVKVSERRTHTVPVPTWTAPSDGDPAHTHTGIIGPEVGDRALLLILPESVWLISWRPG